MHVLPRIKESAIYAWNAPSTLRSWLETRKYPSNCRHRRRGRCLSCGDLAKEQEKEQEIRDATLSNIKHNRRVIRLRGRKRDVSVDGGRRRKKGGAAEQVQCVLLAKLPAELRIQIWEEVLCNGEEICILPGHLVQDRLNIWADRRCYTELLRTCRQIYREAVPILYSRNAFTFHSPSTLYAFTECILHQRLSQIQEFTLATVLIGHARDFGNDSTLYRDPFLAADHAKLVKLFSDLVVENGDGNESRNRSFCLSYRLANKSYIDDPRSSDFDLLRQFEIGGKRMEEECGMVYEIVGAGVDDYEWRVGSGEDGRGGLLFGRWKVGRRVKIEYEMD